MILSDNTSNHRRAWDAIPWVVNGSASHADRLTVESHVQECGECREELAFQHRVRAAVALGAPHEVDAERSWERFRVRLEAEASESNPPARALGFSAGPRARWLAVAAVTAIGVFAALRLSRAPEILQPTAAAYHTLSAPEGAAPGATIRAVFAPTASVQQLQLLLSGTGLAVVAGPSEAGVWALAPISASGRDTEGALRRLRANPAVRFAEPVGAVR
jgi:hypothetical protein